MRVWRHRQLRHQFVYCHSPLLLQQSRELVFLLLLQDGLVPLQPRKRRGAYVALDVCMGEWRLRYVHGHVHRTYMRVVCTHER